MSMIFLMSFLLGITFDVLRVIIQEKKMFFSLSTNCCCLLGITLKVNIYKPRDAADPAADFHR